MRGQKDGGALNRNRTGFHVSLLPETHRALRLAATLYDYGSVGHLLEVLGAEFVRTVRASQSWNTRLAEALQSLDDLETLEGSERLMALTIRAELERERE